MNSKTLSMRMKENYSQILNKLSPAERAFAEKFEAMEYAIERGKTDQALAIRSQLAGTNANPAVRQALDEEIDTKFRCNPVRAEAEQRKVQARRTSDRASPNTMYDPSDFIDQRFNKAGYEQAVSLSPEDAIIDAIDAAKAANTSLEDILLGNATFTKPRGRGRPSKKGV